MAGTWQSSRTGHAAASAQSHTNTKTPTWDDMVDDILDLRKVSRMEGRSDDISETWRIGHVAGRNKG